MNDFCAAETDTEGAEPLDSVPVTPFRWAVSNPIEGLLGRTTWHPP